MNELKTLPLYSNIAVEKDKFFREQSLELKCCGEFVRRYFNRDRDHGDRQQLDPCSPRTSA